MENNKNTKSTVKTKSVTLKAKSKSLTGQPLDNIELNPQLDDRQVKEQSRKGVALARNQEQVDEVLSVQQRFERGLIMKRYQSKIERAREVARKRVASEDKLKRRSMIKARDILRKRVAGKRGAEYEKLSPAEKMQIDAILSKRKGAIKRIAKRILPKVKAAEYQRLSSFMRGDQMKSLHTKNEEFNQIFEQFSETVEITTVDDVIQEMTDLVLSKIITEKQIESLQKRANKSGIDFDILEQVYVRGLLDTFGDENAAFNRVNAFVNGGRTAMNEDYDLYQQVERPDINELFEARAPGKAYIKRVKRNDGESMLMSSDKWGHTKYWRDSEGGLKKAREHSKADLEEMKFQPPERKPPRLTAFDRDKIRLDREDDEAQAILRKRRMRKEETQIDEMGGDQHYSDTKGATSGGAKGTPIKPKKMSDDALASLEKEMKPMRQTSKSVANARSKYGIKEAAEDRIQKVMHKGEHVANIRTYKGRAGGWMSQVEPPSGPDDISHTRKYGIGVNDTKKDILRKIKKYHATNEEVQQTNENFIDGKGPGKPGDAQRHGLKGKSATELRKIRSSETASPRKKQLAHWLLNMHHNESVNLGEATADERVRNHHAVHSVDDGGRGQYFVNLKKGYHYSGQRSFGNDSAAKALKILKHVEKGSIDEGLKDPKDNPCWDNYKPVGTKKLRGKTVPNCVPEAVEKVTGTNCKNCVFWREDLVRPVSKDEINENGGLKAPSDEYIKMSKEVDLATLPGKATVAEKGFCDNDKVMEWVTERMCCALWDGEGTKREFKGDATFMEQEDTSKSTKARRKIEVVDRKPPYEGNTRQGEIQKKIIDENNLNEAFNIAYGAGIGVTLTAADLGMKAQGGFAYHPSVIAQMEDEDLVDEAVTTADKSPVVVPAHKDAYGNTIPAKTVMRKKNKVIVNTGDNPSDGK